MGKHPTELVFGSVQLGLCYGAANKTGKPSHEAAMRLVRRAADAGIKEFDTARAYGDSEERLGLALAGKSVRIVTKLSPLVDLPADASLEEVRAATDASIEASRQALGRERLDCLLLHRAGHRVAYDGAIWERLLERVMEGSVAMLGVSVQSPPEALDALACPDVKHIQMPYNLLDRRWREAGVPAAIIARGDVTVHARSIFLQGLLAANDPVLWPRVPGADATALVCLIAELTREFGRKSAADLCLAYVRGQSFIDGAVVGIETEAQLEDNLRLAATAPLGVRECAEIEARIPSLPEALLNPALWPKT